MHPACPPRDEFQASRALHLCHWGDEFVAYHALSGDTHLLDAPTGQLLQALQHQPQTLEPDALRERLLALALIEPSRR